MADFNWRTIGPSGNFRCYSDTPYRIKTVSISCDSIPYIFLSINEQSGKDNIRLFPNPSSGIFTIQSQSFFSSPAYVFITNILGRKVFETIASAGSTTCIADLSHEPAGIYLLRLSVTDKQYYVRLVLQP